MFFRLTKTAGLFLGVLSLSACAENWQKPGATQQDFKAAESVCETRAAAQFPPLMHPYELQPGHTTPTVMQCTHASDTVTCTKSGGDYIPPDTVDIDDNEDARDEAVRSCLYKNGWRPVD